MANDKVPAFLFDFDDNDEVSEIEECDCELCEALNDIGEMLGQIDARLQRIEGHLGLPVDDDFEEPYSEEAGR